MSTFRDFIYATIQSDDQLTAAQFSVRQVDEVPEDDESGAG